MTMHLALPVPVHSTLHAHALDAACPCPCRYSKDRPRMGDALEIIKFMCKEFWLAVFKKQVDNLRTNHRVRINGHAGRIS